MPTPPLPSSDESVLVCIDGLRVSTHVTSPLVRTCLTFWNSIADDISTPHRSDVREIFFAQSRRHASNDENQTTFLPLTTKKGYLLGTRSLNHPLTSKVFEMYQSSHEGAGKGKYVYFSACTLLPPRPSLGRNPRSQDINPSISPGTVYALHFGTGPRIGSWPTLVGSRQ